MLRVTLPRSTLLFSVLLCLVSCQCNQDQALPTAPVIVDAPPNEAIVALAAPMARPDSFRRGISLGLFVSDPDESTRLRIYGELLDEIRDVGATDVQIVVRQAQPTMDATTIGPKPEFTSSDKLIGRVVDMARERGIRAFLMPIVHIEERGPDDWRGTIKPKDLDAWWNAYTAFILHYATLSARHQVELFSIGSELVSMERYKERWRELARQVRTVFPGKLTYSANWDHYEPVQFWDAVDVVGLTAYHELSRKRNPAEDVLVEGWTPFARRLRGWAARKGHDYIFTEIGYPSNPYGAAHPWDYRERGYPDPALQLRCFRAMYRVWQDDPRLSGLYIWNWFGYRDLKDRGYTPRGKPSEHVIRHWYQKKRGGEAPVAPDGAR